MNVFRSSYEVEQLFCSIRPVDKIHFGLKKRNEESRDCYFNANVYFDKLPYVYIDIV